MNHCFIRRPLWMLCLSCFAVSVFSDEPPAILPVPAPPQIKSTAHILIDHNSGQVLAERDADQPLPPASLTKLMTFYVVASEMEKGGFTLGDQVSVSEKAWRSGGSRMFIEVGQRLSVDALIRGLVVSSGNDASIALAEFVSGSEEVFASLMNHYAAALGMRNSHFLNSSGLPQAGHYASARDLAHLTSSVIRHHPVHYRLHAEKVYTYGGITQRNRNVLLWRDDSVDGVKTGHTEAAGYCLIASAERQGMRLISVVMGVPEDAARFHGSQALFNYGFRFYETGTRYHKAVPVQSEKVWKGALAQVQLGLQEDFILSWPRGMESALQATVILDAKPVLAPITAGQRLGELRVEYRGQILAKRPLLALHAVDEGGLLRRAVDGIRLWFADS